ncbi:MAG: 3-oxoacyl-ACP synthase III family protein [Myxococcaceae bacterium]|nr:3-oxoacyl-ACP synthase III family protein [Myxococcaceae bacterium]MCI0672636.1 3-oxoacyl-ACP synthase III family protein [Myxococcaceae bacterium]
MKNPSVGLQSLAVAFPETVRTNDYFRERCPDVVAQAEQKSLGKIWRNHGPPDAFNEAMAPFLGDVFRGTVERRVLGPRESIYTLEKAAVDRALEAAGLKGEDVDLLLATSLLPRAHGIGDAANLAGELGIRGPGWNFESACSGSFVGLQMAAGMVASGQYRRALVIAACSYSQGTSERDNLGWTCGDGAAAYVVGPQPEGFGVLGAHSVHTADTCGHMWYEPAQEDGRGWYLRLTAGPEAGKALKAASETSLRACVQGAAEKAGVSVRDIDFFVFNTPLAWYVPFCARVLEVPLEKTINTYDRYANTGPVLMPTNLFHAAHAGRIKKGDLVMLYTIGSVSSAGAAVVRWGDVGLGPAPA